MLSVALDAKDIENYFLLGLTHFHLYEFNEAEVIFLNILKTDSNYYQAVYYIGRTYYKIDKYKRAEIMLSKAIDLSREDLENVLFFLAISQSIQGKKQECQSNMDKIRKVNPKSRFPENFNCD